MDVREISRNEIEEKIKSMGDYVMMGYLSSCLKKSLDFNARKFVLIKLTGLYESGRMFLDAGKMMNAAADINTTFQGKITDFVKAVELFIKAEDYELADSVMKKALAIGNENQKKEVRESVKEFYKTRARFYIDNRKKNHATKAYEKLLMLDLSEDEKLDIRRKLLGIYESLGRIREYNSLKRSI